MSPADSLYRAHIAECPAWCRTCRELAREADIEDGRRLGWPEPEA